jgi:hypothetical protein
MRTAPSPAGSGLGYRRFAAISDREPDLLAAHIQAAMISIIARRFGVART